MEILKWRTIGSNPQHYYTLDSYYKIMSDQKKIIGSSSQVAVQVEQLQRYISSQEKS